ncbi:MAG: hypothetical protein E7632_02815 [Ruminococcaceae bacterium]|nr:hypothetical protein [Oscillospiraceae bacterium]
MKNLKLILCGLILAGMAIPAAAGVVQEGKVNAAKLEEGTLIYVEDFDGFTETDCDKALEKLGWKKVEDFSPFTASYTVENGKLIIKNNKDGSKDSYALMMDSDYLKNVCNQDYTYEYEVTYKGAANTTRYVSLLCNYDGMNNYNTVDMRIGGDGYNQTRREGQWPHYNGTTDPIRQKDDLSVFTQLFGTPFNGDALQLVDKTITIRVETSIENGPVVYVNDLKASEMLQNESLWQTIDAYAMAFKASHSIDAEVDNIKVWTGLSDEPLPLPEPEPEASASTADMTALLALAAAAAAGVAFTASKKR